VVESMILESTLQTALLLAAPRELPDLRLFRRNIGTSHVVRKGGGVRAITFGVAGQSDLYALVRGGKHIEIELKSATGRLTTDQAGWAAFCHSWGVQHIVLHAEPDETTEQTIQRWCSELRSVMVRS